MLTFAITVVSVWTVVNLVDILLKSCKCKPYQDYLRSRNLSIKPFRLEWFTTRFNHRLNLGVKRQHSSLWFDIGTVVTLCLIPVAIVLLTRTLMSLLSEFFYSLPYSSSMDLTPVLPGVNLPFSDLPFYVSTLVICGVFHEFGHALAASWEGVRVNGVGAFVIVIVPGAYVDLPFDALERASPWRRIKIFCGGVWHNLIIAGIAWLLLTTSPTLLSPFFRSGVSVISVTAESGADGPGGLWTGDEILSVNDCEVESISSWRSCIMLHMTQPQMGGCVPRNYVIGASTASSNSCCSTEEESSSNICFSLSPLLTKREECLPARRTLAKYTSICSNNISCHPTELCVTPKLPHEHFRLLVVKRENVHQDMLFVGLPEVLWKAVRVMDFVPKTALFSVQTLFYWETLLKYLTSFSMALALLNVMPCYSLDGTWIFMALIELIWGRRNLVRNQRMYNVIMFFGTALVGVTVTLGLLKLFYIL